MRFLFLAVSIWFAMPQSHVGIRESYNAFYHSWTEIPLSCPACLDSIANATRRTSPPYAGVKKQRRPSLEHFYLYRLDPTTGYFRLYASVPPPLPDTVRIPRTDPGSYNAQVRTNGLKYSGFSPTLVVP
jgi:hypothetical protein